MKRQQQPLSVKTWTLYTSAGWLTGFVLTLLIGLPLEAIGIGNQSMIGLGMGAGVGLTQARLLNRYPVSGRRWFWSSFIGMSIPYILYDVVAYKIKMTPEQVLPVATAIGSLLAGTFQYQFALKPIKAKSKNWIIVTCLGWTIAHVLLIAINFNSIKQLNLPLFIHVIFVVLCILGGGPILGLITGRSIVAALKTNVK